MKVSYSKHYFGRIKMENQITTLLLLASLVTNSFAQQSSLQIGGALQFSKTSDPNVAEGTMIWTGTILLLWNGKYWTSPTNNTTYAGLLEDMDGHLYPIAGSDSYLYMTENLRTTRFRNGASIEQLQNNQSWANTNEAAWSWYDNDPNFDAAFGKLYNWYAVVDERGLCPDGWFVASLDEWKDLVHELGISESDAGEMKEPGNARWKHPNVHATNASNFSGVGSGIRLSNGFSQSLYSRGHWWSSSDQHLDRAVSLILFHDSAGLLLSNHEKKTGMSVRCLKKKQ